VDVLTILRSQWDRVAAIVCVIAGIVTLILGYHGVASSPYVAEELAYLVSGGLGGVFLLGIGATLYMSADMHDEWRKLDRIEAAIHGQQAIPDAEASEDDEVDGENGSNGTGGNGKTDKAHIRVGRGTSRRRTTARLAKTLQPVDAPPGEGSANIALLGTLTVALVVIVVGWTQAAGTSSAKTAFSGLAVSLAGAVAAAAAVAAYTFWLRRAVGNRQVELLSPYLVADAAAHAPVVPAISRAVEADDRVLVGAGLTHFHRPGCPATIGVKTRLTARNRVRAGLTPCGICGAR
jgi:hypothetical protein